MRFFLFLALCFQLSAQELIFSSPSEDEVLALGSAITDYFVQISDEEMRLLGFEKGSWAPSEIQEIESFLDRKIGVQMASGGSAVNVVKGLSHLGRRCAVIGKIGEDHLGKRYVERLKKSRVTPLFYTQGLPTGRALCLVTPDGQKTMRTFLGASHHRGDLDLNPQDFARKRLFHIEGYQVLDPELLQHALTIAKEKRLLISMDLGNFTLVQEKREEMLRILEEHVDIVFCNQDEARVITKGMTPMDACCYLSKLTGLAIVTMGEHGGWVKKGKEQFYFPAIPSKTKDTTGAGDLFASGFLHSYLKGKKIEECAWTGAYVASKVVEVIGAEIPASLWKEMLTRIQAEEEMALKEDPLLLEQTGDLN